MMNRTVCILVILILATVTSSVVHGQMYETEFRERAALVLGHTADKYNPPSFNIGDPEKYYWPYVIARFEKYGIQDSIANHCVRTLSRNSPFHFTLIGMARILYQYRDAPSLKENYKIILQNVFDRTDSYNAWTGEGTENHVSMSRTSGYLYAQEACLNVVAFPQAATRLDEMDSWLRSQGKQIYKAGTGEWNSSTYMAYNLIGWLNLYDFASNAQIKNIARAVLDYYVTELALHYSFGSIGGSEMRGSNSTLKSATSYLGWLWFGEKNDYYNQPGSLIGNQYIQCAHAATSKYRPPEILVKVAQKRYEEPVLYQASQPAYLLDEPSFVKQFFLSSNNFTLGSASSKYGGYTGATSQIVSWKLVIRQASGTLPVEIVGNGMYYDNMPLKGRDPYTQVVQNKNVLIQMTCVPVNEDMLFQETQQIVNDWNKQWYSDFKLRFPDDTYKKDIVNTRQNRTHINGSFIALPESIRIDSKGTILFIEIENTFLAIRSVRDTHLRVVKEKEHNYIVDQAELGKLCGLVLEVGDTSGYPDLASFKKSINRKTKLSICQNTIHYTTSNRDKIKAEYQSSGSTTEAISDWGFSKTAPSIHITSPPLKQPAWPVGEGWGKIPSYRINMKRINVDSLWPVWQGPNVNLHHSILQLRQGKHVYEVNYQDELPSFSEFETK